MSSDLFEQSKLNFSNLNAMSSAANSTQQSTIMTPSSTADDKSSVSTCMGFTVPRPGKTYRIHRQGVSQVISLVGGKVQLQNEFDAVGGGWFWICVEKDGWLGFKNYVSGTFLGLAPSPKDTIHAKVTHHKAHEFFHVRHSIDGGYALLVKYYDKDELRKLTSGGDGETLLATAEGDGALWNFEEV